MLAPPLAEPPRAELLQRLVADRPMLVATLLDGEDPGDVAALTFTGKAVLTFADGRRVVHQPRSLDLDAQFNEILGWFGQNSSFNLRQPKLLARRGYGWTEYVETRPCSHQGQVSLYYEREGALLALLYVLNATGLPRLVPAGDQPVLVDVGELFKSDPGPFLGMDPAADWLRGSLARTTLLPEPAVRSRPELDGVEVDPRDFRRALLAGFSHAYDVLAANSYHLTSLMAGLDQKLEQLGEVDRGRQEWLIHATLATRSPALPHRATPRSRPPRTSAADPDRVLAAAAGIADELVGRAVGQAGSANWIGLQPVDDRRWAVLPCGPDLANGYLGIALFLAEIGRLTGAERYLELAADAVRPLPDLLDRWSDDAPTHGTGMQGLGGIVYALSRLDQLGIGEEPGRSLSQAIGLMATDSAVPTSPGFADGDAGALAALSAVGHWSANLYADRLAGIDPSSLPTGFAEGIDGILWALREHQARTGRPMPGWTALAAREPASGERGWCTGSVGSTLVRLAAGELKTARWIEQSAAQPYVNDQSLCHGEIGALEPLVWLRDRGHHGATAVLARRTAGVLGAIEEEGPRCGTPDGVVSPGLLTGLAGIGYGLLRLGFPNTVPGVLLLEPAAAPARSAR